eukprot:15481636-Alexandrium_andersonii.AAC.1
MLFRSGRAGAVAPTRTRKLLETAASCTRHLASCCALAVARRTLAEKLGCQGASRSTAQKPIELARGSTKQQHHARAKAAKFST